MVTTNLGHHLGRQVLEHLLGLVALVQSLEVRRPPHVPQDLLGNLLQLPDLGRSRRDVIDARVRLLREVVPRAIIWRARPQETLQRLVPGLLVRWVGLRSRILL